MSTVTDPVVVVLEWASGDCSIVAGYTEDISASSAQWLPGSNNKLVFVGYSNDLPTDTLDVLVRIDCLIDHYFVYCI